MDRLCDHAQAIRDADKTYYPTLFGRYKGTDFSLSTIKWEKPTIGQQLEKVADTIDDPYSVTMNKLCYDIQREKKLNLCMGPKMNMQMIPGKGCCVTAINSVCKK